MKNFLILLLAFSTFISAEEYEFEPEPNKAEYYSGKFNQGKDMEDLLSWGEKFAAWTNARSEWDTMRTVVFTPYYSDNLQRVDYVWLNLWPSAGKQYKAIEQWIKDGGKLASTLPVTNERVTDVKIEETKIAAISRVISRDLFLELILPMHSPLQLIT